MRRPRFGIGLKLFLGALALIGVSVLGANTYLTRAADSFITETNLDDLSVRARVVAREAGLARVGRGTLGSRPTLDVVDPWDALADALAQTLDVHVTILRADGYALGDSELDPSQIAKAERQSERPEVLRALEAGASDKAVSAVTERRMTYVALPFRDAGNVAGVVRIAKPFRSIDRAIAEVRGIIFASSGLALLFAAALSGLAAQRIASAVRLLTDAARRMTDGDLQVRTHARGTDELAELGRAFDQLAGALSSTLGELRAERDLHARILEGMHEGVLVLDEQDRIVLVNSALREMLLLGADSPGKLFLEAVRDAQLHETLRRARDAGGEVRTGEIEVAGIKPRKLLVHAVALQGDGGLLAVLVDVTDLRRLESLRRDFVANVSHELRTPVASVRSAAETLRGAALRDPTAAERFLNIIDRNAARLQALIEDLLELSRLDAREYRLKPEVVDIDALVHIVVGTFREKAETKGVRLAGEVDESVGAIVTDPKALEQILVNLVDNAVKYGPADSSVTVIVGQTETMLQIDVVDTGLGIAEEHLPRLFERFYRVDAGRSRDVGGTGLGLSIVKHLAEALGGSVRVKSSLGKGSVFSIELPRTQPGPSDAPPPSM